MFLSLLIVWCFTALDRKLVPGLSQWVEHPTVSIEVHSTGASPELLDCEDLLRGLTCGFQATCSPLSHSTRSTGLTLTERIVSAESRANSLSLRQNLDPRSTFQLLHNGSGFGTADHIGLGRAQFISFVPVQILDAVDQRAAQSRADKVITLLCR